MTNDWGHMSNCFKSRWKQWLQFLHKHYHTDCWISETTNFCVSFFFQELIQSIVFWHFDKFAFILTLLTISMGYFCNKYPATYPLAFLAGKESGLSTISLHGTAKTSLHGTFVSCFAMATFAISSKMWSVSILQLAFSLCTKRFSAMT